MPKFRVTKTVRSFVDYETTVEAENEAAAIEAAQEANDWDHVPESGREPEPEATFSADAESDLQPVGYRFHLVCPICNKESETTSDKLVPTPHVNCGDCLMERIEVVEMKVVAVREIAP
jgi:hypothetical protein